MEFDIDEGGWIESAELMELGVARRLAGQKQSSWTLEKNEKMMKKMDEDRNGIVDCEEFIQYMMSKLRTEEPASFDATMEQFHEAAMVARARHLGIRAEKEQKLKEEEEARVQEEMHQMRERAKERERMEKRLRQRKTETDKASAQMAIDAACTEAEMKKQIVERGNVIRGQDPQSEAMLSRDEVKYALEVEKAEIPRREVALMEVFQQFDIDGGGTIEAVELMELGVARREAGQKKTMWTKEKNDAMLSKMDANNDGKVT